MDEEVVHIWWHIGLEQWEMNNEIHGVDEHPDWNHYSTNQKGKEDQH